MLGTDFLRESLVLNKEDPIGDLEAEFKGTENFLDICGVDLDLLMRFLARLSKELLRPLLSLFEESLDTVC